MLKEIQKLKKGDTVCIQDVQIVEHFADNASSKLTPEVKEVSLITNDDWTLRIIDLDLFCETVMKMFVFEVGEAFDIHIASNADWVPAGTKSDLLESGHNFLFEEPEDIDNFDIADINISTEFTLTCNDEEITLTAPMPTVYGEDEDENIASFTSFVGPYFSAYILDFGDEDSWVEYYEGQPVKPELIELFIK